MVNQVCETGFTSLRNFALMESELSIIILKSTESKNELGKNFKKSNIEIGREKFNTYPSTKSCAADDCGSNICLQLLGMPPLAVKNFSDRLVLINAFL